jgi:hypothetical protein
MLSMYFTIYIHNQAADWIIEAGLEPRRRRSEWGHHPATFLIDDLVTEPEAPGAELRVRGADPPGLDLARRGTPVALVCVAVVTGLEFPHSWIRAPVAAARAHGPHGRCETGDPRVATAAYTPRGEAPLRGAGQIITRANIQIKEDTRAVVQIRICLEDVKR